MKTAGQESDNRRAHRGRVLKRATIIVDIANSEMSCTIRNQHSGGAELKISPEARVPQIFLLYVPVDGVAYKSIVRWRRNDRLGVEFTSIEPKPRLHYG